MKDELENYIEELYIKYTPTIDEIEDPSLNPIVIKARKVLLDGAFDGDMKARKILKEQYGLTMLYRNGKEIIL